jgi:transposase-like protein
MGATDDLKAAAVAYRQAQRSLDACRERLAQAVRAAIAGGMSQSEVSRVVGVDRLTIRKWMTQ